MRCPICNTEKPRLSFRRRATLAQTRAWLKNPNATKPTHYYGKDCNECHKQVKRKPSEIPPSELRRRLTNEGMNPLKIELLIEQRKARGTKKKSEVAKRTLSMRRKHLFTSIIDDVDPFIDRLQNKHNYYKYERTDQADVQRFLFTAMNYARTAKWRTQKMVKEGKAPPHSWQSVIDDEQRGSLRDAYLAMPEAFRYRFTAEFQRFAVPTQPQRLFAPINKKIL